MCVGHIDAYNGDANFHARHNLFQGYSYFFAEKMEFYKKFIVNVENVVDLLFRNHKHVSVGDRRNIEESETVLSFGNLVARNLTCHYS